MERTLENDRCLWLPQLRCFFEKRLPDSQVLLVAGGRPPQPEWLRRAASRLPVWCVDSGIDICQASQVIPRRLIGDGDSADPRSWAWSRELGIPVEIYPPEKDLTDLQLALRTAGQVFGQAAVIVTGVWGGRFDHAFSNVYSLKGCTRFGIGRCCAADENEVLILLEGADSVRIEAEHCPEVVSLLPLSAECTGVGIDGVRWPLRDVVLQDNLPYAVSNRFAGAGGEIAVSVAAGWLGVYLCWNSSRL